MTSSNPEQFQFAGPAGVTPSPLVERTGRRRVASLGSGLMGGIEPVATSRPTFPETLRFAHQIATEAFS